MCAIAHAWRLQRVLNVALGHDFCNTYFKIKIIIFNRYFDKLHLQFAGRVTLNG